MKYNFNTISDVLSALDDVCDKEKQLTDKELADEMSEIYKYCNGGNSNKDFFLYHIVVQIN